MNNEGDLTRESVLEKLFKSWDYGNLGLFIGAGFSKTITKNEKNQALGWVELIKEVTKSLKIEMLKDEKMVGISLPEVAGAMCKILEEQVNSNSEEIFTYTEAKLKFKEKICAITNWIASEVAIEEFRLPLLKLKPNWIITTNYDLLLESILYGKCESLHPKNYLSSRTGIIPIYHIHGIRTNPESIVITHDDYIPLFRPNEYRQVKLAITIRESTTLVLGYALGDINVLSALDWSRNIYNEMNEYPHAIIQAVRMEKPKYNPYKDENNIIILEIESIESLILELLNYIELRQNKSIDIYQELESEIENLNNEESFDEFTKNDIYRKDLLVKVSQYEYIMIEPYIKFFEKVLSKLWDSTYTNGNFKAYNDYLKILLDIVINYEYEKISPRLFRLVAEALNRVFPYITDGVRSYSGGIYSIGTSYSASRTWGDRKKDIPEKMYYELLEYAKQNDLSYLLEYLDELFK